MNIIKKENLIMEEDEEQQFVKISPDSPINENIDQQNSSNLDNQNNLDNSNQSTSRSSNQIKTFKNFNEIKFKLKWSIRDELIHQINYLNLLLESDTEFVKDELIEKNNDLICVLSNLQTESDDNYDQARKRYKSNNNESIGNDRLFVLITNEFRMKIIEKLIWNLNCVINCKDLIEKDDKINLKDENAKLSNQLLHLEVDFTNLDNSNDDLNKKSDIDDLSKLLDSDLNEKSDSDLNKKSDSAFESLFDKLDDNLNNAIITQEQLNVIQSFGNFNNQFANQTKKDFNRIIANLEDKIANLENELVNQSIKLKSLTVPKPEILLTYEFDGVRSFFKKEDQWFSNYFPASNFEWTIQIESTYDTKTRQRFLGLFLNIANSSLIRSYKTSWRCKTNFEIRLLSFTDSVHNRSTKHSYLFTKPTRPNGVGTNTFMTLSDLFDPKFGYISNNKIMIQVLLDIEKIDLIKLVIDSKYGKM